MSGTPSAGAPSLASPTQNTPAAPEPTGATGPHGFSKRGIAYNDVQLANTFSAHCPSCGWAYNWGSVSGEIASRLQYVPMLWGDREEFTRNWDALADEAIAHGAKALFSFNEPDLIGQANMDASHAADKHIQHMNKYAGRALIGAPAVSNSNETSDSLYWLENFLTECESRPSGCVVDFCNVHWYHDVEHGEELFDYLARAHEKCNNRPIWLTEFAPKGSDAQIAEFLVSAIPRLEELDYIHAYAYFMVAQGSLMQSETALSSFGSVYASVSN